MNYWLKVIVIPISESDGEQPHFATSSNGTGESHCLAFSPSLSKYLCSWRQIYTVCPQYLGDSGLNFILQIAKEQQQWIFCSLFRQPIRVLQLALRSYPLNLKQSLLHILSCSIHFRCGNKLFLSVSNSFICFNIISIFLVILL